MPFRAQFFLINATQYFRKSPFSLRSLLPGTMKSYEYTPHALL